MAHGGLDLARWNPSQAKQFAGALWAALEPVAPAQPASARFAVFRPAGAADPGLPLREPDVRPVVDAVAAFFEQAGGVVAERAAESALRALPARGTPDAGTPGRKAPVGKPAE
jgi:hypothetical protein